MPEQPPAASRQPPEEELPTARDDEGEPSGDGDASAEAEIEDATERPEGEDGGEDEAEHEEPLARAEREGREYLELAQRTQADFENYRKRAAKEAAAAGERAKGGLVRELLPVVDNLERALASAEGSEHLAEGVRLVHSELVGVLERNGVEPFDPAGEQFDPELHEALSTRSDEGAGAGLVLDTVEKGYRLNGSVLRPARVVVSG